MTWPGIEPQSLGPLANTLPTRPIYIYIILNMNTYIHAYINTYIHIYCRSGHIVVSNKYVDGWWSDQNSNEDNVDNVEMII